ncbi:hypothetical protein [Lacipirellula limnantheis]|uniref:Uncharacterized protein n=1 Tax=Lacipirellula limnantheis TaxID=2528024 RepID=A0A517TXL3_9BACT|nr:hypothetical protein [Lacipirellula limnantheis]QDT73110.1 hypothetical protein I41_22990 [Lacipirellula limnantheis]
MNSYLRLLCVGCVLVGRTIAIAPLLAGEPSRVPAAKSAADIGSRWELFVDDWLIDGMSGAALKLNTPERREVVLVTDAPWEGISSAYFSVVQDADLVRLYYRGSSVGSDLSADQVTCVVESRDGIHFTRPNLGIVEVAGSKENNVVWKGIESHNFSPFLDENPDGNPDERYKALAGLKEPGENWQEGTTPGGLFAFVSADGIHWRKKRKEPVISSGTFDSLNLAFWDPVRASYGCYSRIFTDGVRAIQSSRSDNFLDWSAGIANRYAEDAPSEHFYTNATLPCPQAEHLLVSFPKRFVPERRRIAAYREPGVSDAMFMSSRDGVNWDRPFLEAWVRPGRDEKNWTDRNNMPAWGIAEASPGEWSMYISEHYQWPDNRIRRLVLPRHRFASVNAGARGGEFTTRPVKFEGEHLTLNYATSAAGSVQVELQDENGRPLPRYLLAESIPMFGDELDEPVTWQGGNDVSALAGRNVRIRIVLKDADLYALRFAPLANTP